MVLRPIIALVLLTAAASALADGPADNVPDQVRRIPPPGIEVPEEERTQLRAELDRLAAAIAALGGASREQVGQLTARPPFRPVTTKALTGSFDYEDIVMPEHAPQ